MPELAVTAIGADRPGIVAAVAEILRDRGGNVEDSAMTILGGQFAMMLIVETGVSPEDLQRALREATADLQLDVTVRPVGEGHRGADPTHVLSVYGRDRPGLLAGVARALADLGVNITDVSTRRLPPDDDPVYAMVLEIWLPDDVDEARVEQAVAAAGEELGLDHTLRPLDAATY